MPALTRKHGKQTRDPRKMGVKLRARRIFLTRLRHNIIGNVAIGAII